MSAHLGRSLTAYVDGELDDARREEVQVHLAHCASCRADLQILRGLKSVVADSDSPALPGDLAMRLLAATAPVGGPHLLPRPHAPRRPVLGDHPLLRRTSIGAGLLALGVGGALAVAGPAPSGPPAPVDPTSAGFVLEHISTANELPLTGPEVMPVAPASALPAPGR